MRRLLLALGLFFGLLVIALVGLDLWVNAYLRSDAFRALVAAKTGDALHADTVYQKLDWSGSSVFSSEVTARGADGSPIQSLDAGQVRANVDWRAIFGGAWRVDDLEITRLELQLRSPAQSQAAEVSAEATPRPAPPKQGFLPNRFELARVFVQDASVSVGSSGQIRHSELTINPEGSGWLFDGSGGQLELTGRQTLDIERFRIRLQQGVAYVTNAALRLGANGSITGSGEIGDPNTPFDVQLNWQNIDVADVLDSTWKSRLTGVVSGQAHCVARPGRSPLTTGSFKVSDGQLQGIPVQKQIADFTRSPQFEHMPVQEISGNFSTDGTTTTVTNFVLESQGLVRVEGECRIGPNGGLSGTFQVGVTSQCLEWLPGSQERVFVVSRNGYLWTMVNVGGTIESPTEDLSSRLAKAVGEELIGTGAHLIESAPDHATDAARKAVDLLSPLIPVP